VRAARRLPADVGHVRRAARTAIAHLPIRAAVAGWLADPAVVEDLPLTLPLVLGVGQDADDAALAALIAVAPRAAWWCLTGDQARRVAASLGLAGADAHGWAPLGQRLGVVVEVAERLSECVCSAGPDWFGSRRLAWDLDAHVDVRPTAIAAWLARGYSLGGAVDRADDTVAAVVAERTRVGEGLEALLVPHEPPLRPAHVRVMAEIGTWGLWGPGRAGGMRHAMLEPAALGLSAALAGRLEAWIARYDWRRPTWADEVATFDDEGRALARAVAIELGSQVRVTYAPDVDRRADEEIGVG
ncbi:MAG TPA: hypothetical protein PKA64_04755, partial [Myxococcota bacterium]|nr:hypothetical protein [Myxococcota bacterium]